MVGNMNRKRNEMSGQVAMHNGGAEARWGSATQRRPFGPVVTPEEMAAIHAMEDMSGRNCRCVAQHEQVVDQPDHYKHGTFEVIDELVMVFGLEATINFCLMNAWKYRARAPFKGKPEQDMEKADRYMQYAHDLLMMKSIRDDSGDTKGCLPLLKSKRYSSQFASGTPEE